MSLYGWILMAAALVATLFDGSDAGGIRAAIYLTGAAIIFTLEDRLPKR